MSPSGVCYCQLTACKVASLSLSLSLCVDLTLSLSISPSLCANGVRVLGNFVARNKRRGAASHGIRHPPYHPDDPECQLPSPALQGAACHSGCGSCVSGIEESSAKSLPLEESKATIQYCLLLDSSGTIYNTLPAHPKACRYTLKKTTYTPAKPNMGRLHQQVEGEWLWLQC